MTDGGEPRHGARAGGIRLLRVSSRAEASDIVSGACVRRRTTVVARAASAEAALDPDDHLDLDAVVTDLKLAGMNGLQLTRAFRHRFPEVPVVVVAATRHTLFAEQAIAAGALGYVVGDAPAPELVTALETVMRGDIYLPADLWDALVVAPRAVRMTPGENEVFRALAKGNRPLSVVAERLGVRPSVLDRIAHRLVRKFGVGSLVALRLVAASTNPRGTRT